MTEEVKQSTGEGGEVSRLPRMVMEMSIEQYSDLMLAVGFLDGVSSFLWTKADSPDGIAAEAVGLYDERVGSIRTALSSARLVERVEGREIDA